MILTPWTRSEVEICKSEEEERRVSWNLDPEAGSRLGKFCPCGAFRVSQDLTGGSQDPTGALALKEHLIPTLNLCKRLE